MDLHQHLLRIFLRLQVSQPLEGVPTYGAINEPLGLLKAILDNSALLVVRTFNFIQ
jgi:hypothetical protein